MRKRPLLLIACVFLAGLAYQRYSRLGLAVVGLLLILWDFWIGRKSKNFQKIAGRSIVLLSAFLIGIFQMQQEMNFRATYMSKIVDGSRITVWGELIKLETTEYGNRGILSECYIDFGEGVIPSNDIMVYTSSDQYEIGQIHKITGKVNMFSGARNQGNFDSLVYYQSLKIDFAVDEEVSEVLGMELGSWRGMLLSLREKMSSVYETCLSERAVGFYQAMVLGDKTNLDEMLKDLFLLGGISHILAISGLHVSILGRGMYRVLRRCGLGFGLSGLCGGILLVAYCVMVGNSTSTIRAVGMMLLFFMAQWIGRSYDMLNSLGGMALILLWENPFLIENSGFWFSVMALVGVGLVGKEIWMSLAITLATLPITALSYYEIPMYSPIVNMVILPFLTPIFCLALLGGVIGSGFPITQVLSFIMKPCQWLLVFYEWVCKMTAKLPGGSLICGKPEWWQVLLYYSLLFGGVYVLKLFSSNEKKGKDSRTARKRWWKIGIVLACYLCIFLPKDKPFEITFLDVGQGDGIYISAGDGSTYFIDGGSSSENGVGEYRMLPFLKSKGIKKIDYWFVSHCDSDHISGILEMMEKDYKIKHIVLHERSSHTENHFTLVEMANKKGVNVVYMKTGDQICSKNMQIHCIGPLNEKSNEAEIDANENSMVLQVEWKAEKDTKGFRALFAGDVSVEVEHVLCESGILQEVDLVKANHHGSNYSNGSKWFEYLNPEYIVVSCSKRNLYGHPGKKAVERMEASGAKIFYTMEGGQITFPLIQ